MIPIIKQSNPESAERKMIAAIANNSPIPQKGFLLAIIIAKKGKVRQRIVEAVWLVYDQPKVKSLPTIWNPW